MHYYLSTQSDSVMIDSARDFVMSSQPYIGTCTNPCDASKASDLAVRVFKVAARSGRSGVVAACAQEIQ